VQDGKGKKINDHRTLQGPKKKGTKNMGQKHDEVQKIKMTHDRPSSQTRDIKREKKKRKQGGIPHRHRKGEPSSNLVMFPGRVLGDHRKNKRRHLTLGGGTDCTEKEKEGKGWGRVH